MILCFFMWIFGLMKGFRFICFVVLVFFEFVRFYIFLMDSKDFWFGVSGFFLFLVFMWISDFYLL